MTREPINEDAADIEASAFGLIDTDGDGLISATDIAAAVHGIGLEIRDEDAAAIVAAADTDGDGLISESEFDAVRARQALLEGVASVEDAFAAFDADGDGFISVGEVEKAAVSIGLDPADASALIESFDSDGDGKLSFEDFSALFG
ncbi:EF-hand domain-containing protein [Nocardia sp. NPDC059228]|uniref:EF-hand domain-containing protein n=1 Tax=Nocardia sp. NPDC059228 TaxID=3346777 RepID=UPI0036C89BAE